MRPLCDPGSRLPPLRVVADHEGFADELAGLALHRDQRLGLAGVQRDRLLAQHVLAGARGARGPLDVHVVGQRVVDDVDLGIGQQLLVAAIGLRDPEATARRPGPFRYRARRAPRLASAARVFMPGRLTFCAKLLAPSTPQRTGASVSFAVSSDSEPADDIDTSRPISLPSRSCARDGRFHDRGGAGSVTFR